MSRTHFLSTIPTGTQMYITFGKKATAREYVAEWNADALSISWNDTVYQDINKWAKAVSTFHHADDKRRTCDVWKKAYIHDDIEGKKYLSAFLPTDNRCDQTEHWMIRVGDGANFWKSTKYQIWCADSKLGRDANFLKMAHPGDILWFITTASKGHIIAMATYTGYTKRCPTVDEDLLGLCKYNEELGWTGEKSASIDTEISYKDVYDVRQLHLLSNLKCFYSKVRYNDPRDPQRCDVNLPTEYTNICKYSAVFKMPHPSASITSNIPSDLAALFA